LTRRSVKGRIQVPMPHQEGETVWLKHSTNPSNVRFGNPRVRGIKDCQIKSTTLDRLQKISLARFQQTPLLRFRHRDFKSPRILSDVLLEGIRGWLGGDRVACSQLDERR